MEQCIQNTIDCRGLVCPQPVIETRDALQKHPETITVLVDNEPSSQNVSRFLTKSGYSAIVERRDEGTWAVTGSLVPGISCVAAEDLTAASGTPRRTLVLLTTERLGQGDDLLGEKLMGNFLATLPEMEPNLWRIVMLNGGVKLAATEGKALDALRKLADDGIGILVCGTCLEHYGLLEQKAVGETTNMLDIVTSLDLADKVIRP